MRHDISHTCLGATPCGQFEKLFFRLRCSNKIYLDPQLFLLYTSRMSYLIKHRRSKSMVLNNLPAYRLDPGIVIDLSLYPTGGSVPYTISTSTLPPGLSISGSSIVGAPTTIGNYTTTLSVTDALGTTKVTTIDIVVPDSPSGYSYLTYGGNLLISSGSLLISE